MVFGDGIHVCGIQEWNRQITSVNKRCENLIELNKYDNFSLFFDLKANFPFFFVFLNI